MNNHQSIELLGPAHKQHQRHQSRQAFRPTEGLPEEEDLTPMGWFADPDQPGYPLDGSIVFGAQIESDCPTQLHTRYTVSPLTTLLLP
jgi:hypothetical protein